MQPPPRKVTVIGAALDLGPGRRGVDMGPSAIRYAGLDEPDQRARATSTCDRGNVGTAVAEAIVGRGRARPVPASDQGHLPADRRRSSPRRPRRTRSRSSWAATTPWRSERSAACRRCTARAGRSGSTPTATSTARRRARAGNVHGMVLAAALGLAGDALQGRRLGAARVGAGTRRARSASARSTRASGSC